jgi:hypothetical protein
VEKVNDAADAWAELLGVTSSGGLGGLLTGIVGEGSQLTESLTQGFGNLGGGVLSNPVESITGLAERAIEGVTVNIQGNVYGVEDIQETVMGAIAMNDNRRVSGGR